MMESIRNFLQLRNTPTSRVQGRAEGSGVPGGAGRAAGRGLRARGWGGDGAGWGGGSICVALGWGFFFFSVGCWEADGALRSSPAALPSPPSAASGYFGAFTSFLPSFPPGSLARRRGTRGRRRWGVRTGLHPASHILFATSRIPCLVPHTPHPPSHGLRSGGRGALGGSKSDRHTCTQFAEELFFALPPLPLGSGSPRPGEALRPGAG